MSHSNFQTKIKEKIMKPEMPSKHQILKAAGRCGDVDRVMRDLFPWAFEDEDLSIKLYDDPDGIVYCKDGVEVWVSIAFNGQGTRGKSFAFTRDCNWEHKIISGFHYMIPTRKPKN